MKIAREFRFKLRIIGGNRGHIETGQNRVLGFSFQQELEGCLYTAFRAHLTSRQLLVRELGHGDLMLSFTPAPFDRDGELKGIFHLGLRDFDPAVFAHAEIVEGQGPVCKYSSLDYA